MSDTTTRGVRIQVKTAYLPDSSAPDEGRYLFAYRIRISNVGDETVQLISRDWIITDSRRRRRDGARSRGGRRAARARPRAVLRVHELLPAAHAHRLDARQPIRWWPPGGQTFDATIAPFSLAVPNALN